MKQTKKLFSIVLAIALVFAMAIPAFAAEAQTGTIKINGVEGYPVADRTFEAYKILDAVAVNPANPGAGVLYSVPAAMAGFYADYFESVGDDEAIDDVVAAINALKDDTDALQAFAQAALEFADGKVEPVASTKTGDEVAIKNAPFGYYLINDVTVVGKDEVVSALMLNTSALEVTLKIDQPTIEKKIDGDNDLDNTTTGLVDYNTAKVGEVVPYVLLSEVPKTIGYETYKYIVKDSLSNGLTFVDGEDDDAIVDVVITVGGNAFTDYVVEQDGQNMTITFNDMTALTEGDEIRIEYAATVNENAIVGVKGNPNKVYLEYSNNPQDDSSTTETPEDEVRTYLVNLVIEKVDGNGAPLAGAEFTVTDKAGNVIGKLTTTDAEGGNILTFKGLKDGEEYTIEETVVPAGYNKADIIKFTVDCTDPANPEISTDCVWAVKEENSDVTFDVTDEVFETRIENLTGSLLPETGGMGTTMFYMIGAMMVAAAVVLLVSKKRMAFEA